MAGEHTVESMRPAGFRQRPEGKPREEQRVPWELQEVVRRVWITMGFLASYPDLFSPLYQYLLIYFQIVIRFISYCLSFSLSPQNIMIREFSLLSCVHKTMTGK